MKRKTPPTMHVDTPTKIFIKPTPDPELLLGRCGVRNFLRLDLDPLQNSLGTRSTNPLKSTPASNTMKANCPFLGRVSTRFLQHAGRSLSVYSERCPVMSRLLHTNARGSTVNLANSRAPLNMGEINYWFLASSVIVTIILMVICPLGVYIIYIYMHLPYHVLIHVLLPVCVFLQNACISAFIPVYHVPRSVLLASAPSMASVVNLAPQQVLTKNLLDSDHRPLMRGSCQKVLHVLQITMFSK